MYAMLLVLAPSRVVADESSERGHVEGGVEVARFPSPTFFVGGTFAGIGADRRHLSLAARFAFIEADRIKPHRIRGDAVVLRLDVAFSSFAVTETTWLHLVMMRGYRDVHLDAISDIAVPLAGLRTETRQSAVRATVDLTAPGARRVVHGISPSKGVEPADGEQADYVGLHLAEIIGSLSVEGQLGAGVSASLSMHASTALGIFDDLGLLGEAAARVELTLTVGFVPTRFSIFCGPSAHARGVLGSAVEHYVAGQLGLRASFD